MVDYEYPFQVAQDAIRASTFCIKLDEGGTVASLGLYFKEVLAPMTQHTGRQLTYGWGRQALIEDREL